MPVQLPAHKSWCYHTQRAPILFKQRGRRSTLGSGKISPRQEVLRHQETYMKRDESQLLTRWSTCSYQGGLVPNRGKLHCTANQKLASFTFTRQLALGLFLRCISVRICASMVKASCASETVAALHATHTCSGSTASNLTWHGLACSIKQPGCTSKRIRVILQRS